MLNNKHQRLHHLLSLHLPYHCNVDGFRQSFVCILISMTWDVCLWLVGPTVLDGLCSAGVSFAGQNTEDRPLILRLAGPGDRRHGNRSCPNTTTTHVEPCLHLIQRVARWNRPERIMTRTTVGVITVFVPSSNTMAREFNDKQTLQNNEYWWAHGHFLY